MRIALATFAGLPEGAEGDRPLAEALRGRGADVAFERWDDPEVAWPAFDRVVVRSPWDYTHRREEFLAWAEGVGERLQNRPEVLRWNSHKGYLGDLAAAGIPVVETLYVGPEDPAPDLPAEVVIKPVVSAGARDTGRFGAAAHDHARALLARLGEEGRTAMVQPYLPAVDESGETAIVFFAGEESHVLRKRAVLARDEEAPMRTGAFTAAEVMFSEDLVGPGEASGAERALAEALVGHLGERFGAPPLYARVDMLQDERGEPVLLELEAVEPALYFEAAPGSAARLAAAVLASGWSVARRVGRPYHWGR